MASTTSHSEKQLQELKRLIIEREINKDNIEIVEDLSEKTHTLCCDTTIVYTSDFLDWITTQATAGNSFAQNFMSIFCARGIITDTKGLDAIGWLKLSAEQGNAVACHNMGCRYRDGTHVEQNYDEAIKWFKISADIGYSAAHYSLGMLYQKGVEVEKDMIKALRHFKCGADKGHALSMAELERTIKMCQDDHDLVRKLCLNYLDNDKLKEEVEELRKVTAECTCCELVVSV